MKTTLNRIIIFAAGVGLGVGASYKYFKTKYEKIANEEIASIKEYYRNMGGGIQKTTEMSDILMDEPNVEVEDEDEEIDEYEELIADHGYIDYSNLAKEAANYKSDAPYVISPEEFGEIDGYETANLTHYADGVLTDDRNNVIENVERTVGLDYASHFGDYEDDAVHVRNDEHEIDYEILMDLRRWSDVSKHLSR